jgi:hypothetical protein
MSAKVGPEEYDECPRVHWRDDASRHADCLGAPVLASRSTAGTKQSWHSLHQLLKQDSMLVCLEERWATRMSR